MFSGRPMGIDLPSLTSVNLYVSEKVVFSVGPYPFTISRNRVTEEKTKVNFLKPTHDVLNFPNKIGAADFDDWVQERGIYFAGDIDPKYEKILCPEVHFKADF